MKKTDDFKLIDVNENIISYMVSNGSTIFKENTKNIIMRNLIEFFSDNDRERILSALSYKQKQGYITRRLYLYTLLLCLYIISFMCAIPLSQNEVKVISFIQPGGILIFPLTFVFIDSINEIFGRNHAKITVQIISICLIIAAFFIYVSNSLASIDLTKSSAFSLVYSNLPKLLVINAICVIIADSVNNYCYSFLRYYSRGKLIILRCVVSTMIGQLLYSIIWIFIFFYGKIPLSNQITLVLANYEFKLLYGFFFCLPLTVVVVSIIKRIIYKSN